MKYSLLLFATTFILAGYNTPSSAAAQDKQNPTNNSNSSNNETIVVTGQKSDTKIKVDRIVYSVKIRPDAASLDTLDVLRKVPSVFVSASQSVTMNGGAYVSFTVNGRPVKSSIALSLPASQIKQIEVVSNPGAEFSSDTEAVINIITNNNINLGWSGSLSAKANSMKGYRAGLDILRGGIDWDFTGSLSYRHTPEKIKTTSQYIYDPPQPKSYITQTRNDVQNGAFDYIRTSAKWLRKLSEKRNLSFELGINNNLYRNNYSQTDHFSGIAVDHSDSYTKHEHFTDFRQMGTVSYENDKENDFHLSSSIAINVSDWNGRVDFEGLSPRKSSLQNNYWYAEAKADIEKKIYGNSTLFIGFSDFEMKGNDYQNFAGYIGLGESKKYNLNYTNNNFAAYAEIQTKISLIEIKPGLRFERIARSLKNNEGTISSINDTIMLLPSVHISKSLNEKNKLMASVTLRSDIPDIVKLNPAPIYNSLYEIYQGNPNLRTAKKRQFELNHVYDNKVFSINQRLYYRNSKDDLNDYTILRPDGVYATSTTNLGTSITYGYAASIRKKFSKKLDASLDFELFHKEISAPDSLTTFSELKFQSNNFKININYNPDKNNNFTFVIGYKGKVYDLGMDTSPVLETDFQYNHNFAGRFSLQVNVVNFGLSQNSKKNIYGESYIATQLINTPSSLLRIGVSKAF